MFKIPEERYEYYQWDLNQRIIITDNCCNEVHFYNAKCEKPLTCPVKRGNGRLYADVPNILLQDCLPIIVYAYVKGKDASYTKTSLEISVRCRPKPDDYVYSETEVQTWESAVELALETAKESGDFKGDKGDTGAQGPRGEKGDKGDTGDTGAAGKDGYTPVKGVDYGTPADQLEAAIICQAEGKTIGLYDASDLPLAGLRVFGRTTQSGTPSPEAPVALVSAGSSGSVAVTVTGKNLIPYPYITADKTQNGVTFTVQNDGGIKVSGTPTAQTFFNLSNIHFSDKSLYAHGDYTDGAVSISGSRNSVYVGYTAGNSITSVVVNPGGNVNEVIYPQVEYGTVQTAYEPYQSAQTLQLSTPNGLPGIPVDSGGNYTDANGQQWVCDEIDLARGVYVQRIGKVIFNGEENWTLYGGYPHMFTCKGYAYSVSVDSFLSSAYPCYTGNYGSHMAMFLLPYEDGGFAVNDTRFGEAEELTAYLRENPMEMVYILREPTETPIPEAELAAYRSLHTNKPNTSVYSDTEAWMEVSYGADTKTYIDNKLAELAAAIVNNG